MNALFHSGERSKTVEKVVSFSQLANGWHYGAGQPATEAMIGRATSFLPFMTLLGLTRTDAFYNVDGEILISAYHDGNYVGVIFETDGSVSFSHELNGEECCSAEHIQTLEAKKLLRKVAGEIWPIYALSTQRTLMPLVGGLMSSLSANLQIVASHSSIEIVPPQQVA